MPFRGRFQPQGLGVSSDESDYRREKGQERYMAARRRHSGRAVEDPPDGSFGRRTRSTDRM